MAEIEGTEPVSLTMNGQSPQPDQTGSDQPTTVTVPSIDKTQEMRKRMESWLNKAMRIRMSDGRTLVGTFICTDKDRNVILGSCEEYVSPPDSPEKEEPRVLGLAMVPGQHIVSIEIDDNTTQSLTL